MRSTSQLVNTSWLAMSSIGPSKATYSRSQETGTFIGLELTQHAQVVLPERAQVGEAVTEHRDALDAEPEREPGPHLRVVADVAEDVGVDDARPAHLDPAGVLAHGTADAVAEEARDVELHRRLREREVARAHAHLAVRPEERTEEGQHGPLEIGERN